MIPYLGEGNYVYPGAIIVPARAHDTYMDGAHSIKPLAGFFVDVLLNEFCQAFPRITEIVSNSLNVSRFGPGIYR